MAKIENDTEPLDDQRVNLLWQVFGARSAFSAQRSTLNAQRSTLNAQRSRSAFSVQRREEREEGREEAKAKRDALRTREKTWLTVQGRFYMIGHVTVHVNGSDSLPGHREKTPSNI